MANPVGPVKKVKVKALRLKRGMKVRVSMVHIALGSNQQAVLTAAL